MLSEGLGHLNDEQVKIFCRNIRVGLSTASHNIKQKLQRTRNEDAQMQTFRNAAKTFLHPQQDKTGTLEQIAKTIDITQQPHFSKHDETHKPIKETSLLQLLSEKDDLDLSSGEDEEVNNFTIYAPKRIGVKFALSTAVTRPIAQYAETTALNLSTKKQTNDLQTQHNNSIHTGYCNNDSASIANLSNPDVLQPASNSTDIASQSTIIQHAILQSFANSSVLSATNSSPVAQAGKMKSNLKNDRYTPY